jgi:hypothetical protein
MVLSGHLGLFNISRRSILILVLMYMSARLLEKSSKLQRMLFKEDLQQQEKRNLTMKKMNLMRMKKKNQKMTMKKVMIRNLKRKRLPLSRKRLSLSHQTLVFLFVQCAKQPKQNTSQKSSKQSRNTLPCNLFSCSSSSQLRLMSIIQCQRSGLVHRCCVLEWMSKNIN